MKRISIVVPCFNEIDNIDFCYRELVELFDSRLSDYQMEIVFADDASTDGTVEAIHNIATKDSRVRLVVNARNYGVYRNSFNALKHTTGDAVVPMMPVDLQDPPEVLPKFVTLWEQGNLVVAGARYEREESWIMKQTRRAYYRIVSRLADYDVPKFVGEFQLVDRTVVDQLVRFDDYYPYTRGLIASLTRRRVVVPYVWRKRERGKSKQTLWKLLDQGINGIVSTSTAPLRLIAISGFLVALIGLLFGILQVVAHLTFSRSITDPGVSSIIVLVSFFGGLNALAVGVTAEYLGAVHAQVRGRWRVIEAETLNCEIRERE